MATMIFGVGSNSGIKKSVDLGAFLQKMKNDEKYGCCTEPIRDLLLQMEQKM